LSATTSSGVGHANFHPIAHAIRDPVELMGANQGVPSVAQFISMSIFASLLKYEPGRAR
jgi:hypothetical protein